MWNIHCGDSYPVVGVVGGVCGLKAPLSRCRVNWQNLCSTLRAGRSWLFCSLPLNLFSLALRAKERVSRGSIAWEQAALATGPELFPKQQQRCAQNQDSQTTISAAARTTTLELAFFTQDDVAIFAASLCHPCHLIPRDKAPIDT